MSPCLNEALPAEKSWQRRRVGHGSGLNQTRITRITPQMHNVPSASIIGITQT